MPDKQFVRIAVDGGRKNWLAEFPVVQILSQVKSLIVHHEERLKTEEEYAFNNRHALVEAVRTAKIPDPNRTKIYDSEKDRVERAQAELDAAVTHRRRKLGELHRWKLFLDAKNVSANGETPTVLLTIDDLTYFRMGALDMDNPDEDDKDDYGRYR